MSSQRPFPRRRGRSAAASRNVPARLPSCRSVRLSCTLQDPPQLSPRHHHGRPRDCRRAPVLRTRTACSPHIVGPPPIPAWPRREIFDRPSGSARIPDRFAGQDIPSPSPPRSRGSLCSAPRKTLTSKHGGKFRRGNARQTTFVMPCQPGETRLLVAPSGLDARRPLLFRWTLHRPERSLGKPAWAGCALSLNGTATLALGPGSPSWLCAGLGPAHAYGPPLDASALRAR